jgi:DNA-binding NarL/FixJ family response regulator
MAAILKDEAPSVLTSQGGSWIPTSILDLVRRRKLGELSALRTYIRIEESEYLCRAYLLESSASFPRIPLVGVYLERSTFAVNTVYDCSLAYHLTVREAEVLRGISMGLATKEIATRLNISPNTVKAFLRLVMIKMGVATRGEMFAKILESKATMKDREDRLSADGKNAKATGSGDGSWS